MELLRRKIDRDLASWKSNPDRLPLIIKGARQIGKTESIRKFARENYAHVVEINFVLQKQFRGIFEDGFPDCTRLLPGARGDPALLR